jgi:hypothetical protein
MKKILILSLILCIFLPSSASAHVLLQNSERTMGAVLHITPDDDPIAGESSNLVFDIQDQAVTNENYSFTLQIFDSLGAPQVIPTSINKTVISASHIFPTQGLYRIELRADPVETAKQPLTFTHSQLVSRGSSSVSNMFSKFALAEIGLIASGCGLLILGILFWNNREVMKKIVNKK